MITTYEKVIDYEYFIKNYLEPSSRCITNSFNKNYNYLSSVNSSEKVYEKSLYLIMSNSNDYYKNYHEYFYYRKFHTLFNKDKLLTLINVNIRNFNEGSYNKNFSILYLPFYFLISYLDKENINKLSHNNIKTIIKLLLDISARDYTNEEMANSNNNESSFNTDITHNKYFFIIDDLMESILGCRFCNEITGSYRTMNILFKYMTFIEIQQMLLFIYNKDIKFHDFINCLPRIHATTTNNHDILKEDTELRNAYQINDIETINRINKENSEKYIKNLLFILKNYNKENIIKILPYINYKQLFERYNNLDEKIAYIERIILGINARRAANISNIKNSNKSVAKFVESTQHPIISKYMKKIETNGKNYLNNRFTKEIFFSKNPIFCSTLGEATGCCYRLGGIGAADLITSVSNPIAGNIISYDTATWFSFVWEFVLYNEELKAFEINLVLDNIESLKPVDFQKKIMDLLIKEYIAKNNIYSKVFLGTMRNDLTNFNFSNFETIFKPIKLSGYNKNNPYDDSKNMYHIYTNKIDSKNFKISILNMEIDDIYRCNNIENRIYSSPDTDFLKYATYYEKDISFVWRNEQVIFGYFYAGRMIRHMVEKINYMNDFNKDISINYNDDETKKYLRKVNDINNKLIEIDLRKTISIYDFFLINHRSLILSLNYVFKALEEYIKKNEITAIEANYNEYSKPFLKRIEKLNVKVFNVYPLSTQNSKKYFLSNSTKVTVINKINEDIILKDKN